MLVQLAGLLMFRVFPTVLAVFSKQELVRRVDFIFLRDVVLPFTHGADEGKEFPL